MAFVAVGSGLAAVGGGSALAGAATVGGLGMSAYSMFSGGGSGGAGGVAPSSKVNLTDRAKSLEKTVHGAGDTRWRDAVSGKLNDNLVSAIFANIRRTSGMAENAAQDVMASSAARTTTNDTLRSGNQVKASVIAADQKATNATAPTKQKAMFQKQNMKNVMGLGQNIMNMETQTPMLRAQSMYGQSLIDQSLSQQQGNMLGSIAQFGGMMAFNNAQNKWYDKKGY